MKLLVPLIMLSLLVPALASAQTTVSGRVVGADGRPAARAHAHLKAGPSDRTALVSVACDSAGRFALAIPDEGIYTLELTATDHQLHQVPLLAFAGEPIALDARLAANNLPEAPEEVMIIGDFNEWSFREPELMEPQGDGTFAIDIPSEQPRVAYQVMFPIGSGNRSAVRSVNGTHSEDFVYDGGGDYRSLVGVRDGVAHIRFDPRRATRSELAASVTFADTASRQARYAAMVRERDARLERFYATMMERMEQGEEMLDLPLDAESELAGALRRVTEETEPTLRAIAMVHYLTMKSPVHDSALARTALREIEPSSDVWMIDPVAVVIASRLAGDAGYVERVLAEHPSQSLRAQLMFEQLVSAHFQGDTAQARRWYDRLVGTFPEHELAMRARFGMYNPDRRVRNGAIAPGFSIASIDGRKTIDNASLAGRYLLVDFWETWCIPCVKGIGNLEESYQKHGAQGLVILSVSFDPALSNVERFRSSTHRMPWLHALAPEGFESEIARAFEVRALPKPVLIDPNGVIVAMGEELRGGRLEKTLSRFLDDREVGTR